MYAHRVIVAAIVMVMSLPPSLGCGQTQVVTPPAPQQDELAKLGFARFFVNVPEANISYVLRKGAGPTLLLIPGSFDRAESYLDVIARLSPTRQIVIVELRGHGQSWPPPTAGSIEQFAADVLAVADDARLPSFFVGGHSIGGMVAIECARQRPQRLNGVISIEGWTHASVREAAFQGNTDSTLKPEQKSRRTALRRPTTQRWTAEQIAAFTPLWTRWNGADILRQTSLPVLELWGDRGRPRPVRATMQIPDRSNITVKWVAGASHFLTLERPAETANAIDEFIIAVESRGTD